MDSHPVFYIVDGHALAYRQYFALPVQGFSTRTGMPTNAVYGFARTLLDIMQKDKPKYIAVSFDMGLSGRDVLYGEYKGTRDKMPDELRSQLDWIVKLVEAFNMPVLAVEGYEADDVIGTIAPQAEAEGVDVRIVTGDRDILQLLTPHVTVQLPNRGKGGGPDVIWDEGAFRADYGLEPWQLVEYKALVGDTSDNIPGVKGIGEKGATTLLQSYQTIENLYAHIDEIKGATQKKLIEGRDSAFLSRQLATIQRDVPLKVDLDACVSHDYDVRRVDELFGELEFRSLRTRLPKVAEAQNPEQLSLFGPTPAPEAPPIVVEERPPVAETVIVNTEASLNALVEILNVAGGIAWDVETTGINPLTADLVGISLAVSGETGYYIPVGHQEGEQLPLQTIINGLRPPLTNPAIPKYAHNADYDLLMMQRYGIDVAPVGFDTMIAEWLREPMSKFLGLKNLARQELGVHMTEISDLIGSGKKQITMDKVPVEQAAPYAAADAAVTHRLVTFLRPKLVELDLLNLYNELEVPLIPVIAWMERTGVIVDTTYLKGLSEKLAGMLTQIEVDILQLYRDSGFSETFNINSTQQLSKVLFEDLKLTSSDKRKTKHGKLSTAAGVLETLKDQHPIVGKILEHRELSKLQGTYVDAIPDLINPLTGRVHTSYSQTGAATGRLSSSNPNLQNIPIRTELGREVRRAFVAPTGSKLLSVDYSQVELRILAHVSQDQTLLQAFAQGQDIHAATAAAVYGIPVEAVTKDQRGFAKRVNFGLIYGMGAYRLARDSDLTLPEARKFIETYFARLPGVERYLEDTKKAARLGPVTTLFGRRREFAILRRANVGDGGKQVDIQAEERVAINMPIQGTAADIMKKAMINLYHELHRSQFHARMILQVHDELVLEVPEDEIHPVRDLVVQVMEEAYKLDAPLRANANVGDNWRDMVAV